MDAPHRAGAGLALTALAYLGFAPIAAQGGLSPFLVGILVLGLGLLAAAAGVAGARLGRGLPLLGTGLVVAAAGAWTVLLSDLGSAGLFLVPHALLALGLSQGAWYGVLWWVGTGTRGPREAQRLALTCWVLALGFACYLLLVVAYGFWDAVAQEVVGTLGPIVAARAFPAVPETLEARSDRVGAEGTAGLQEPLDREGPPERRP